MKTKKNSENFSEKKFSVFFQLFDFFFKKNISALVPFSLRVWPAKVLRFWSPRAGPLLLRVTANSSDTRSCCPWKKKIRLFCWCTKSCRYRLEKKISKTKLQTFFFSQSIYASGQTLIKIISKLRILNQIIKVNKPHNCSLCDYTCSHYEPNQ